MLYYKSLSEAQMVLKALSAPMRLKIMELIYQNDRMSMNDLAQSLGLTNGAVSIHVGKLEESGLVQIKTTSGKRGVMKIVLPIHDRLMIDLAPSGDNQKCYEDDILVGQYTDACIAPTCGMATHDRIIGSLDDPKVFSFPEHFEAGILWFTTGFVEYTLPNHLQPGQTPVQLEVSFEISSECPGYNEDYPSDIHFSVNHIPIGMWISPGDYGVRKGYVSPSWWPEYLNQYGLLKTLIINREGCFMDGSRRLSDTTIEELHLDYNSSLHFRVEVPRDTPNPGGCTLFGRDFGDYNQSIRVRLYYQEG